MAQVRGLAQDLTGGDIVLRAGGPARAVTLEVEVWNVDDRRVGRPGVATIQPLIETVIRRGLTPRVGGGGVVRHRVLARDVPGVVVVGGVEEVALADIDEPARTGIDVTADRVRRRDPILRAHEEAVHVLLVPARDRATRAACAAVAGTEYAEQVLRG